MAKFSRDSIDRALVHHQLTGAITTYGPPVPFDHRWRVDIPGYDTEYLTNAEAHALCVGLAAGERKHARIDRPQPGRLLPLYTLPVGGLSVEVEPSHNIVIVEPRVRTPDVVITVTDVERLRNALDVCADYRTMLEVTET